MAIEKESFGEVWRPTGASELEVAFRRRTIDFIAQYRVSKMGGVDSDLVGAASEGACFQQGEGPCLAECALENAEFRGCGRALRVNHALEVNGRGCHFPLANDWGIYASGVPLGVSEHEHEVGFIDAALLHRHGSSAGGGRVFRNENDPAGLTVQAVDERDLPLVCDLKSQEVAESVPQGSGATWFARVDKKAWGLIHREKVRCFADDAEVCLIALHLV